MIKEIEFNNSKQEKIKGVFKEKNKLGLLMIVCQGYNNTKDHPAIVSVTDKLYKMGHSTFSFNFSKSAQKFNLEEQISDIKDIIGFFKQYNEIMILSASYGAVNAAIAATKFRKIKGLITVNGFFGSFKLGLGSRQLRRYILVKTAALFKKQYQRPLKFFKNNYIPEKISSDILVIHVRHDKESLLGQSRDFFKRAGGRKEFQILENGDHHLTKEEYRQEVAEVIDKWLRKQH